MPLLRKGRRSNGGFSLVELMVTVTLVAILARLAIPAYVGIRRGFYNSAALSNLMSARAAIQGDTAKLQASGTITAVGPVKLSIATHVYVGRNVRLTVARNNPTAKGEPQYTITATHTLGTATYTVTQTGKITATGAKL